MSLNLTNKNKEEIKEDYDLMIKSLASPYKNNVVEIKYAGAYPSINLIGDDKADIFSVKYIIDKNNVTEFSVSTWLFFDGPIVNPATGQNVFSARLIIELSPKQDVSIGGTIKILKFCDEELLFGREKADMYGSFLSKNGGDELKMSRLLPGFSPFLSQLFKYTITNAEIK